MDKSSSERIELLRFPLVVGVVYIHNYDSNVRMAAGVTGVGFDGWYFDLLRNLVSQGFARVAVPLFFLLSGYLFFCNFSPSVAGFRRKLYSRFRSLFVPYCFWNNLFIVLIGLAFFMPLSRGFLSSNADMFSTFGVFKYIDLLVGFDRPPIAYQFWFVRDLIVMSIISPFVFFLSKRFGSYFGFVCFAVWILDIWPWGFLSGVGFAFFCVGAVLSINKVDLFIFDDYSMSLSVLFAVSLFFEVYYGLRIALPVFHRLVLLLGIFSFIGFTKTLINVHWLANLFKHLAPCSFFVFAFHEPLLTVIRKIAFTKLQPSSELHLIVLYLAIPVVVVFVSLGVYRAMYSIFPRYFWIASGGR